MRIHRLASLVVLAAAGFSGTPSMAQTTAASGTVIVIPTVANISVYATTVFVRNPNTNSITLNVNYYQSIDGTPPVGLRSCSQLTIPQQTSLTFDMGSQCGLNNTDDNFGMFILEDSATPKVNTFFAYARTQTPQGIGFSVEGFPIGNFSGAPANVLGLQTGAAAPQYRSNCFIGSLGETVDYQVRLWQSGVSPETPIPGSGQITGTIGPYQTHRILDVFAVAKGVAVGSAGTFSNVRANFTTTTSGNPGFIAFCTLETSSNGSADFRIAKSDDAFDVRQSRLACYGMDDCGNNVPSVSNPATVDESHRNIHYMIMDQPDFVTCGLVADTPATLDALQITLRGPGGDPSSAPIFSSPAPFNVPPYTSGGGGLKAFVIYTGEKSTVSSGSTTRWFVDVQRRSGSAATGTFKYGISCASGNGVTVPWLGTTVTVP
jgi:hypothetical protein